ncbi:putative Phosphoserine phosphatase [Candidatus Zixiibacteriota bacterium]|nr:putative Phosphoserine phosphatase [candidate division Zixibacteria bacterium]
MASKIIKIVVAFIGIFLALYLTLFYARESTMLARWKSSGTMNSETRVASDSTVQFSRIDTSDFVSRPFPSMNDTVVSIDDSAANIAAWRVHFNSPQTPGTEISIAYREKGDTLRTTVRLSPVSLKDFLTTTLMIVLRFLISMAFWGVGVWAFYKRPNSGAVRALALFCFAMVAFMVGAVRVGIEPYASFSIPFQDTIIQILGFFSLFFGAFWLNLQLLFPVPRQSIIRRPLIVYMAVYLPILLMLGFGAVIKSNTLGIVALIYIILQVSFGFYLLAKYNGTTSDRLEKRQIRMVLWGTGIGMTGLGLLFIILISIPGWLRQQPQIVTTAIIFVVFLGLLLSPLSFAYAFGRYRLLEVEGKIRKGTRAAISTILILLVFYALIFFSSEFLVQTLKIESRTPILFLALFLALGVAPIQRRLSASLEKKFYPERVRLRSMLSDFLGRSLTANDKKTFWRELESRLQQALDVNRILPILRARDNGHFELLDGAAVPFDPEGEFIQEITRMGNRPIMRDELEKGRKVSIPTEEKDWLDMNDIALVLPMTTRSRLIGFLGIGTKSGESDFEAADIDILQSLSSQMAVAADNILLLEENADKKRLETEMTIARTVQEGMLPQIVPDRPGLKLAAKSLFCTEVAGDYYDLIEIDDSRTVLAIGDVSGKGAGAALLMSNVQASLRTAVGDVGASISLKIIIKNINNLICRNSQPDQFITFFVALFDNRTRRLEYVNAGHNPPYLVHSDGNISELTEGGLLLGAMPDVLYDSGIINLSPGDLLFLFTDGLSEAGAQGKEMFGEERIKSFLIENRRLEPAELLERLEQEVLRFTGTSQLTDDFTLLATKITDQ